MICIHHTHVCCTTSQRITVHAHTHLYHPHLGTPHLGTPRSFVPPTTHCCTTTCIVLYCISLFPLLSFQSVFLLPPSLPLVNPSKLQPVKNYKTHIYASASFFYARFLLSPVASICDLRFVICVSRLSPLPSPSLHLSYPMYIYVYIPISPSLVVSFGFPSPFPVCESGSFLFLILHLSRLTVEI